jgi:uncharacterized protein YbcI
MEHNNTMRSGAPRAGGRPSPAQSDHGATLAAISRRIVGLLKEHYGKGPTKARTYHMGDLLVVLLAGGYTPVEITLLDEGQAKTVMDQRAAFQEVMRPRFQQVIEEELQQEVTAFMSATHHDPDLSAEIFVLRPSDSGDDTPPRRAAGGRARPPALAASAAIDSPDGARPSQNGS